jgi:putrescine aminotransferase
VGAYHGLTGLAMAAGDAHYRERCGPVAPGFSQVPFGDVEAAASAIDASTAAVIMETIPSTAGILIPPPDYFPRLRELCDRAGTLLIVDEVQVGLCRTGRLWAIDEWDVVPDILVLGKALGGGVYPMSATCYRPKLQAFFDVDPFVHVSTFGGAEVGCAVTMAMLDQISEPGFLAHANEMARRFEDGLARLRERHADIVVEVRQRGLMIGLEMVSGSCGPLLTRALARRGVLAIFANNRPSTLMIKPPLIITAEEVDEVLGALDEALPEVAGTLTAATASEGG